MGQGDRWGRLGLGVATVLAAACGETDALYVVPPSTATLTDTYGAEYLAHEVIVLRAPGVELDELRRALVELHASLVDEDSPFTQELGYLRVRLPDQLIADQAISFFAERNLTVSAARNYIIHGDRTPNDPQFGSLWGLTQIGAPNAWERTTGSAQVLVAVVDTGVDASHPDLAPNVWINPSEIAGNGLDDDHNGYVDDVSGWDFVGADNNPNDDNSHGSHVSGTIGAAGNNGIGVAGINWTVRIQALKVLGADGSGSLWGAAQAILYAAHAGAKVVNASFGCQGCNVSYMQSAIQSLQDSGGLFVAAAGNNGTNNDSLPFYPAAYPDAAVISVAATTPSDTLASFSNYGASSVDLAAPGTGILSTVPGNKYASYDGTSMAAPHVTGAIALYYAGHPSATPAEVKARLLATTDVRSSLAGKVQSGGRLNVQALITTDAVPPAAPQNLAVTPGPRRSVDLRWTVGLEPDLAMHRVRYGTAPGQPTTTVDLPMPAVTLHLEDLAHGQTYYFSVLAVDETGNLSPASNEVSAEIRDSLAPPTVIDLSAENLPGWVVSGGVVAASGAYSDDYRAQNAYDGSPDTSWNSPGRTVAQEESLVIELDSPTEIERVDLLPSRAHAEFFPIDFDVEVSTDGTAWTPVAGQRSLSVPTDWLVTTFPSVFASHVRLRVLRSHQHPSGLYYTGLAEVRVRSKAITPDALQLGFTAPGDDPGSGTVAAYDLRCSTEPITAQSFEAATPVQAPAPLVSGLWVKQRVTGLQPETRYYFALKSRDSAGNVSNISNVASASTLVVPPSTVGDLRVVQAGDHAVVLGFTAPGSDALVGRASAYDLRYAEQPITPANFADAYPVTTPAPLQSGASEQITVSGLNADRYYYFALQAIDAGGNRGGTSNVVSAQTTTGPDLIPPAQVTDLSIYSALANRRITPTVYAVSSARPVGEATRILDGDPASSWRSVDGSESQSEWISLDLGAVEPLVRVRLRPSVIGWQQSEYPQDLQLQVSADAASWETVTEVRGLSAAAGTWDEWSMPVHYARYLRVWISKRGLGGCAPGAITCARAVTLGELELYGLTPDLEADLAFSAPGDDGFVGTAAAYWLRSAPNPIDASNWAQATPISLPAPLPGGFLELHRLPPLPAESRRYFALQAVDDAGNIGTLSNVVSITTPGMPPAPVVDLSASVVGPSSVTVLFTATGDDGMVGTASAYDLRYAQQSLDLLTWSSASVVLGLAPPQPPRAAESRTISGLQPDTEYFLAVRVVDDLGQSSLLSNVLRVRTLDGVAPNPVTNFTAELVDATLPVPTSAMVTNASGVYSFETEADNLVDGDESTLWLSPARATAQEEVIELGFSGLLSLARVRLRSAPAYTDLFPRGFRIEVRSSASGAWTPVVTEANFLTAGGWEEWALGAVPALEARLVITDTAVWVGSHYAALSEIEFQTAPPPTASVRLSWTATGDDGSQGTATRYELRRAGAALSDANFATGVAISGLPNPSPAGALERFVVGSLAPASTYCFGLRVEDEAQNRSSVAAAPCVTTPTLPPEVIDDLRIGVASATQLNLLWTAPGAQGSVGTATRYDLRISGDRITEANWDAATPLVGVPNPSAPGTAQSYSVTGLLGQTRYYFGMRAINGTGQVGGLSNVAVGDTLDNVAPTVVTDLVAATDPAQAGSLRLSWTAPGDGETGRLASYEVRASQAPLSEINFAAAQLLTSPSPHSPGQPEQLTVSGLAAEVPYYVALKTRDQAGNLSELSNVALAATREEAPARVSDLSVVGGAGQTSVTLGFTAPGDDGALGTATAYDVRYSTNYLSASNFDSASALANPPSPLAGGSHQTITVTGLTQGTTYYFALKAVDDHGNLSQMSNWVSSQTADTLPPSTVSDLVASPGGTAGRLNLSWTAPGDDGANGLAQAYDLRWSTSAITADNFAGAAPVAPQPAPVNGGTVQSVVATGLPNEALVYVALKARDDAGNWSAVSNSASARTPDVAPTRVTTLTQTARTGSTMTITWTATGDDGTVGQASAQELRYSTQAITAGNFASATLWVTGAPHAAGTLEQAVIGALPADTTYNVALIVTDDRGNASPLSNVLIATTADTVAPAQVSDLAATTGASNGTINLAFAAPGDDGTSGRATRYDLRASTAPITSGNWAAAQVISTAPVPKTGGAMESFQVGSLVGETVYYFVVRAIDEAGNEGPLSANASATTRPVPPSRVSNLSTTAGPRSVTLAWTAPGDDGAVGRADHYEIRYAATALTGANFDSATLVANPPTPAVAGTAQTFVVTPLAESTTYYFGIRAVDDVGAVGPLSNLPSATTPDQTPPAAPGSFSVVPPPVGSTPLSWAGVTASSELGPNWRANSVIDGNLATSWSSASRTTVATESLVADLGSLIRIDRIRLHPDGVYPELFARDFVVETSGDGNVWAPAVREESFSVSEGGWLEWGFESRNARYVRVLSSDSGASYGSHYTIIAELEVYAAAPADGRAQLTWVAPGDDGAVGTATRYDVYRKASAFEAATRSTATLLTGAPTPATAGSLQTMTVNSLAGERAYWWALRAVDNENNVGALSPVVMAVSNPVAPAPIADLSGVALSMSSVSLSWTAPGDDGHTGAATRYELRYADHTLTSRNRPLATLYAQSLTPRAANGPETLAVSGLQPGTLYRFSIVAYDEANTASYASNVAVVRTIDVPDVTPPGAVANLDARLPTSGGQALQVHTTQWSGEQQPSFTAQMVADQDRATAWSAVAGSASIGAYIQVDLGAPALVDHVQLWPAQGFAALFPPDLEVYVSPNGLNWTLVRSATNYSAQEGVPFTASFPATELRYVEVRATRLASYGNGLYYAVVAEVEPYEATAASGTVLVTWTAPGDDGSVGTADIYRLERSACPFNPAAATVLATEAPRPAGTPERALLSGFGAGTYCLGLRTLDEAGNQSPLSNVATVTVP